MAKQKQPPAKTEAEQELERLQAQVQRADEKGLTDTCHHEMLRRALGQTTPAPREETK